MAIDGTVRYSGCRIGTVTMGPEMSKLFDGTCGIEDIAEILDRMQANCPCPSSNSEKLWELRRETDLSSQHPFRETLIEKAVAMLAAKGTCRIGSISVRLPPVSAALPATGAEPSISFTGAPRTAGCRWSN